ncbi:MAG: ABC-F family ATP-binding cassette domain-containing protein, partial [Verrucomicrobia bacterium]|nr:ABC-F family ATP-binding cassette domain-containing protein [Verrucomicrobiota bacterium]
MTLLLNVQALSKAYGSQNLFTDIFFSLYGGDRMGLVGPNGAGKSTLLKILAGMEEKDFGEIAKKQGIKIAYAGQSPEFPKKSIEEIMLLSNKNLSKEEAQVKAQILLHKAGFTDYDQEASQLSGGWKKRLDIVRALMEDPDLVLLDEPTNHLDLEGIFWLEKFIQKERVSYLIVSHDRYFLDVVCTRVIELNRCFPKGVFTCDGNWSTFIERRQNFLQAQLKEERSLAS